MRWFALAIGLFGFAGCLEVESPDGALFCSTVPGRACPEGFYCLAPDNKCWRIGHFPGDMAEPGQFFPGNPDDLSIPFEPDDLSLSDMGVPSNDDLAPNDDLSQDD